MVFASILQKFSEKSPVTVMVQGLLEHLLHKEKILFSSLVAIMLKVVCRVRKNVYSAYLNSNVEATRQAVYDKLKNVELKTSQELVRHIGSESELMVRDMKAT